MVIVNAVAGKRSFFEIFSGKIAILRDSSTLALASSQSGRPGAADPVTMEMENRDEKRT